MREDTKHVKKIQLSDDVVSDHPDLEIRVVVVSGLRNTGAWPEVETRLAELETRAREGILQPLSEQDPRLASWQRAYRAFGTNPRRQRPSVDALCRRIAKKGRLPRINPAVDAYNAVSVRHGVPAGAFDLEPLGPCVTLRKAVAGDKFVPLGSPEEVEEPSPGEVVYADSERVLTRHWNHRDAHPTRVDESTESAVFMLERADSSVPSSALREAVEELCELLEPHCSTVGEHVLNAHERDLVIERDT
nr:phenylalanine--tRNA ligase beta subunit-related protein [Actinopolyspora mortivallis]